MRLLLQRVTETPLSTQGNLAINGVHECFTLERAGSQFKSDFHRIPAGTYKIELYASPHFGRFMPLLVDVPGHSNIEIHFGNVPGQSHGCILVGVEKGIDAVFHSRDAFDALFPMIEVAVNHEGCEIEVVDPQDTHEEVQDATTAI